MELKASDLDVIIIGGGPGGLSAALWCAELGLKAIIIEREGELGGQLLRTYNAVKNHLGVETESGRAMCDIFVKQVETRQLTTITGTMVAQAELTEKTVVMADGRRYSAHSIIIATGVSRRKLGVPGEAEFYGRGILESGERSKNDVAKKRVIIVGGGDAALENALILSRHADSVVVVHRRSDFKARDEFIHRCQRNEKIRFLVNAVVTAIVGSEAVEAVNVQDLLTGVKSTIPADVVLIRVGVEPNSKPFRDHLDTDEDGFIRINEACAASLSDIYAIGDVVNPLAPTISSAVGMGATAAHIIAQKIRAARRAKA